MARQHRRTTFGVYRAASSSNPVFRVDIRKQSRAAARIETPSAATSTNGVYRALDQGCSCNEYFAGDEPVSALLLAGSRRPPSRILVGKDCRVKDGKNSADTAL